MDFFDNIFKGKSLYRYLPVSLGTASFVLSMTWFLSSVVGLFHPYSVIISIEVGIIWTFFALDKWTFKEGIKKHGIKKRFFQYHVIAIAGLCVNLMIFLFFTYLVGIHYLIAEFLAILLTFGFNFFFMKNMAWGILHK